MCSFHEQELIACREAAEKWERQAQDSLAQLERLKDLLEESALWRGVPSAACPSVGTGTAPGAGTDLRNADAGSDASADAGPSILANGTLSLCPLTHGLAGKTLIIS
jgi:hypothetical protein